MEEVVDCWAEKGAGRKATIDPARTQIKHGNSRSRRLIVLISQNAACAAEAVPSPAPGGAKKDAGCHLHIEILAPT
jgi:hypothetical protein